MKLLCVRMSASIELKDQENSGETMNIRCVSDVSHFHSFSEFSNLVFSITFAQKISKAKISRVI